MEDNYRHLGMRRRLVEEIAAQGNFSTALLEALLLVPRHFFFEKAFLEKAYQNHAFPIGQGQTISQPLTVAIQTQMLNVQTNDLILEIGTGSGYQTCILAAMGARVITIERVQKLYEKTQTLFQKLQYSHITSLLGDGTVGVPKYAPFDKILVTAAAREIPTALLEQLKIGACMVIPIGDQVQTMYRITKTAENTYQHEHGDRFRFVPLLKGID